MTNGTILAGIDAGHVATKAVVMRGEEILGRAAVPTGFDVVAAAQAALDSATDEAGVPRGEVGRVVATGIFRDLVNVPPLNVTSSLPDYAADARGGLFLNRESRTVIDVGGNVHKAIRYDEKGNLLDVVQNDKCADGLGIFYKAMAKLLGVSVEELSALALQSTGDEAVAIQCALSAESDAIDLICRGVDSAGIARAVTRFIVERVAAMAGGVSLDGEILIAGGLAKSPCLVRQLSASLKRQVVVPDLPEYVGAIGAVVALGGGK